MGSDAGAACLLRIRPSQPKETAEEGGRLAGLRGVFAFQVNCGLLEVLFALAGEDSGGGRHRLGLLGEIALLGLGEGALNAPILNPLVDLTNDREVGFDPLAGSVEGERGGEVERHRHHQGENDGRAWQVQVANH